MNCEICGLNNNEFLTFAPLKQPNGFLNTIACKECAINKGVFCVKHNSIHQGFTDESTACLGCVEDEVKSHGLKIAAHFAVQVASSEMFAEIEEDIRNWYQQLEEALSGRINLADIRLVSIAKNSTLAVGISRLVVTKAMRMKITPGEIIQRVAEQGALLILS